MIRHICWYQDVNDEEAHFHSLADPTSDDVLHLFQRLDSDEYPSLTLSLDLKGERFPKLFVYGGPTVYAVSLSEGDEGGNCKDSMLRLIHPTTIDLPASCYRVIGRTYPGYEIEERFLSSDIQLVWKIIEYFAETGRWKPEVPFIVEQEGDDGLIRHYLHISGETNESTDRFGEGSNTC